ncbi:transmembrane ascorbate-dependent reductase CYB561-like isoform X1 [Ruditapes philippinarum]|uniref:transmembrane ascorbate-dependent reductase CYB561-like isoform X1 n=2 Tax=Ruditapes philippinarum TaxID=129788 RepID=UPI00295AA708|nr:transmembrane ascorbate-dependent reductase CYB561-like isoform X1 [Ruditapes philippinarum]
MVLEMLKMFSTRKRKNSNDYVKSYENMDPYQKDQPQPNLCYFSGLILLVQGLGLTAVILVAVWMGHFQGGFAWQEDPDKEFNYHPVFMVIGMIFLYADAILAYRVFRNINKLYVKIVHGAIHLGALIFASVALKAVFDSHNLKMKDGQPAPIPNLYSLHSWIGIIAVIMFGLQWVCGFIAFFFPKLGFAGRTLYMPHHVFWGLTVFGLACAAALTGITEKAFILMFAADFKYSGLPSEGVVINCLGLSIIMLAVVVFYLVTRPEYKRPKGPEEEERIQLSAN